MSRRFHRATAWIVDRPWITVVVLLLMSIVSGIGYVDPDLPWRIQESWTAPVETPTTTDPKPARELSDPPPDVEEFGLESDAVLVVESDTLFTREGVDALRAVVDALKEQDFVRSVVWMDEVPVLNLFGLTEPLLPRPTASDHQFKQSRERALRHPLVGGQLLSEDARTTLILVNFDWLFVRDDDTCLTELSRVGRIAVEPFPDQNFEFHTTGGIPLWLSVMQSNQANKYKYQLIGYSMVLLMAVILFRGVTAVFIVALAPSVGVFWTLGLIRYFDLQFNPFNDIVLPIMLSLVGLTDGVHLMVQIRRLKASGLDQRTAAREGLGIVGLACALTSLTTAIGFGSLWLAHHEIVREFGFCCVIGVTVTFFAVITVIPLVSATPLGRRLHVGHDRSLIDQNLNRIGGVIDFVLKRTRLMSVMGIAVTVLFVVATLTLRPDERRTNQVPLGSEAAIGMEKMDRALGGLESARIRVKWDSDIRSDSPEVLRAIDAARRFVEAEELIGRPLSIVHLLEVLPGDGPLTERVSMIELLPPPLKRAFFTPENRRAVIEFRVQDVGIARYHEPFTRIENGLLELNETHPDFDFELGGSAVWRWRNLYQIVVDLATSLGSASVVIFFVLTLVYRSVRLGLISILPNLFPLAVTGAFLAVTGQSLELVSVCAFTVCLGIAVDDTIHFLTRFTEERQTGISDDEAIRRAFTGVGTALIVTTVVLVIGFSTVLFSDNRETQIFAGMGAMTIAAALFGDLVFLPALLSRWAGKHESAREGVESQVENSTETVATDS